MFPRDNSGYTTTEQFSGGIWRSSLIELKDDSLAARYWQFFFVLFLFTSSQFSQSMLLSLSFLLVMLCCIIIISC